MNTLYKRQFALMAGVLLVAFALLGSAFAALSYQYIIQDKRETLERNASYVAAFTSSYLSSAGAPASRSRPISFISPLWPTFPVPPSFWRRTTERSSMPPQAEVTALTAC